MMAFYDGLGQVVQTQGEGDAGAAAYLVSTRYNALGQVISQSVPYIATSLGTYQAPDWSQPQTQTACDGLGRTTIITNTDNSRMRSYYQARQVAVLDVLSHQTVTEADAFGRLISSKQYSGTFASPNWGAEVYTSAVYTYNVRDQLTQVTANNLTTQLSYDLLGRKTGLTDPNMGPWSYTYDAAGNLLTQTDARSCVTTFGYDALNRLTGKSYSGPGACAGTPAVSYSYDQGVNGKGRRTAMAYGSRYAATWRYDGRGRPISETQTIANAAYTTLSSYDAADRLKTLTYPSGGVAEVVTTTYNSQGLAASLVGANVYVPATLYDAAGRVISRTLGSAPWQTQYSYYGWAELNGLGRLKEIKSGTPASPTSLQNLTYTYDAVGNVKTIVDAVNSSQRQCFQYDPLDRLTRATTSADPSQGCTAQAGAGNYSEGYDYYKEGSLKRKGAADNANDGLYTYDANHPHAAATYRGNSYSYDADGNMTGRVVSGVTYTLTYNAENRLTRVVSGTLTASYVHDGDGNRVRSVITVSGAVTETHYVGQHYEKTVGSGDTKYYFIAGQLVAFERSSGYGVDWGRRFVFRDQLGSTNVIINASSGVLLWRDRYLPFGDVRDTYRKDNNPTFSLQTAYRFTGQRLEARLGTPESGLDRGLYFYGARWYDSSLGRFIQADTIVPQPGNPQALNRYSYAANNPLKFVDPTGMYEENEIEQYLRDKYPDTWESYLRAWRADKVFWAMLRAAQNGDRLFAPTTSLGVGFFGAKKGSFTFTSENEAGLWLYQGRGPYALEMANRQFREGFSAQAMATEHPFVGTDENIGLTWEQPLYNYTAYGPEPTGYTRRVNYSPAGVSIDWGASSSIPTLTAVAYAVLRWGTKGAVKAFLGGPVVTGLFAADIGVAFNEGVNINYQLQVDYKDTRTYLAPSSRCLSPCFKAAP